MADKEVKIKIATDVELGEVQALESNISKLKYQKAVLDIQANTSRLEEVDSRINTLKGELKTLQGKADVDDSEIKKVETELEALEAEKINIALDIETSKIDAAQSKADALDDTNIDLNVNNISAMEAIDQIGQGFDRLKSGASEVGQQMGEVLQSAGRMEQTEAFLSMNMGADQAKQKLQEIRSVTDSLPGDDVTLQNLLSQAAMKDASMTTDAFNQMGSAAADYMAAMQNFGKTSTETQQDLMNYILAGNTAEIERSPILQSHIDKLKEGTTVQERAKLLQEALNEEGWAGIASQDIYNNKFQQFNDMIERGKMNLGGMFQEAAKGTMDWLMQLDQATNGLVGMSFALAGFASPITDIFMGIGQIGAGLRSLKDASDFLGMTEKLKGLKTSILDLASDIKGGLVNAFRTAGNEAILFAGKVKSTLVSAFTSLKKVMTGTIIPTLRNVATALINAGRAALTAGLNALRTVAMWTAQKLALVASTLAEYGLAAAQAVLNLVMSMNPIMIVVLALAALVAALIWAYYNVDWFRAMVDNAWQSLMQIGQYIYGVLAGAVQWLGSLFQSFTSQLGLNTQDWIQAIIGFILFLPQLPLKVGIALTNALAKALGFKGNFVQSLISSASSAVSGFVSYITQLPGIVMGEFNRVLGLVNDFINSLPDRVWDMGQAIIDALKRSLGIGSPGHMFYMMEGELERIEDLPEDMQSGITRNVRYLGEGIVDSFHPNLNGTLNGNVASGSYGNTINLNLEIGSVDNEERVREIIDVIRRELNWNNKTAGRGV